ncbi:MAG: crossover junction endodeoxyribonuclease RuvC [Cytophagales bacterium]
MSENKIDLTKEKIILGLDPGTNIMGFGLIIVKGKEEPSVLQYGIIRLEHYDDHTIKLQKIFEKVSQIIREFLPDEVAIEAPFYGKNVQSMLKLGRAQGVAIAAAINKGVPVVEYAPKKVKQSVTGNGNASKEQIAAMLMKILKFSHTEEFLDATDALGVALCHHYQSVSLFPKSQSANGWAEFLKKNPSRLK